MLLLLIIEWPLAVGVPELDRVGTSTASCLDAFGGLPGLPGFFLGGGVALLIPFYHTGQIRAIERLIWPLEGVRDRPESGYRTYLVLVVGHFIQVALSVLDGEVRVDLVGEHRTAGPACQ